MITPADINECKTLRQERRWFFVSGIPAAKTVKNHQELREVLIDTLLDPRTPQDAPIANVIRGYLNDRDAKADKIPMSDELYRALYADNISREQYESAVNAYLQRERSRRRKK